MKTILITGASSGIGQACAERLADKFHLVLTARNKERLESLSTLGTSTKVFVTDVCQYEQVEEMFKSLDEQGVFPEIVINAAGLALGLEEIDNGSANDWDCMINTNIKGLLYVSKFALERMKKHNRGNLINLGSIAGINTYAKGVVYASTKAAVKSISDGLRKEVVAHNIKVTNIQPGLVETNFSNIRFKGDASKAKEAYRGIQPLSAEDIANVIEYVINTPDHVQINEITLTPTHQATVEVIYRNI